MDQGAQRQWHRLHTDVGVGRVDIRREHRDQQQGQALGGEFRGRRNEQTHRDRQFENSGDGDQRGRVRQSPRRDRAIQLAAWSLVRGFATLWHEEAPVNSALTTSDDPETLARAMLATVQFD